MLNASEQEVSKESSASLHPKMACGLHGPHSCSSAWEDLRSPGMGRAGAPAFLPAPGKEWAGSLEENRHCLKQL